VQLQSAELPGTADCSEHADRDIWSEWVLKRRCGGDQAEMKRLMEYLGPVRDKVLAHAQLKENETLLDIGCGDRLIAFKTLQNNRHAARLESFDGVVRRVHYVRKGPRRLP
jgi:hypothetical protein